MEASCTTDSTDHFDALVSAAVGALELLERSRDHLVKAAKAKHELLASLHGICTVILDLLKNQGDRALVALISLENCARLNRIRAIIETAIRELSSSSDAAAKLASFMEACDRLHAKFDSGASAPAADDACVPMGFKAAPTPTPNASASPAAKTLLGFKAPLHSPPVGFKAPPPHAPSIPKVPAAEKTCTQVGFKAPPASMGLRKRWTELIKLLHPNKSLEADVAHAGGAECCRRAHDELTTAHNEAKAFLDKRERRNVPPWLTSTFPWLHQGRRPKPAPPKETYPGPDPAVPQRLAPGAVTIIETDISLYLRSRQR